MLLLLGSCAKETDLLVPAPAPETKTIHYSLIVEEGSETRSTLGPGYKHVFEAGDRIYVESTGDDAGKMYGFLSMSISGGVGQSKASLADDLHTIVDGKVTTNYTDKSASSIEEAVRKYAHFTGSGQFGGYTYTLQQHSSFLVCALSFDPETTPDGTPITAKIYNNGSEEVFTHTAQAKDVEGDIEVSWVIPFGQGFPAYNLSAELLYH